MYYVRTTATRELTRAAIGERDRTGSRTRRTVMGIGSLATAQRVARMMLGNGLLR